MPRHTAFIYIENNHSVKGFKFRFVIVNNVSETREARNVCQELSVKIVIPACFMWTWNIEINAWIKIENERKTDLYRHKL